MKKSLPKQLLRILGFVVSIALIWYILRNFDIKAAWEVVRATPPFTVVLLVVLYMSTFFFRSLRWQQMLQDVATVKIGFVARSILIGFAGNNLLPARGGELLRMEHFSRVTSVKRATSLSSILLEKVIDAVVLISVLTVTLSVLEVENDRMASLLQWLWVTLLPITFVLALLRVFGGRLVPAQFISRHAIFDRIRELLIHIQEALRFMKWNRASLIVALTSIAIWAIEASVFIIAIDALDDQAPAIAAGTLALCFVNFSILVPSSPGYIGVFQVAVIYSLSLFGVQTEDALALAILIHSCQYIPVTLFGGIFMFREYTKLTAK